MAGAALGTGSAMAHRAVDGVLGPRGGGGPAEAGATHSADTAGVPVAGGGTTTSGSVVPPATGVCVREMEQFAECMSRTHGDLGLCQQYFDAMQSCRMQYRT